MFAPATTRLHRIHRHLAWAACLGLAFWLAAPGAGFAQNHFQQINLVSSVNGLAANTDANLQNPWGISISPTSPFWVSNQVTHTATLYNGAGTPLGLVVAIPSNGSPSGPTGQVFNSTASDFQLISGGKALFMFANLNGSIAAWNGAQGTNAIVVVSGPGASYTGLALGNNGVGSFLYAANSSQNRIDAFNATFGPASLPGSFTDPNLPSGFTPYNIQNLGGTLFVTYENEALGGGVVNAFDANGNLLRRISANAAGGPLESPWGMALAPAGFGPFGGALLVGNEDDGRISAFDPATGNFLGQLLDAQGNPISNLGLWGLAFGTGAQGTNPDALYFAAGIQGETEGLFGAITQVPEPATVLLMGMGAAATFAAVRRRRARRRASRRKPDAAAAASAAGTSA